MRMVVKLPALWRAAFAGLVLCLALIWSAMARAAPWPANPGSKEQAAEAIRLFERDPAMGLPPPRRVNVAGRPCLLYELKDGRRYEVDVQTGRVLRAAYLGTESPAGAKGRITPQKAEEIARNYATEKFTTFMSGQTRTRVYNNGAHYTVEFRKHAPASGAELPHFSDVVVNAKSGAIFMASLADHYPIPAALGETPAVTEQQALRIFTAFAGFTKISQVHDSRLRWVQHDNREKLAWEFRVSGVFRGDIRGIRGGGVDARTGDLLATWRYLTPDYRIVDGPNGKTDVLAQGPSVTSTGGLRPPATRSRSPQPPVAIAGLVAAALLTLAAGAIRLRRPRPGQAIRPEAR